MKTKKVFSLFLAMKLCKRGHKIVGLELNKIQNKQVYVFEVDDTLEVDFGKLIKEHNEKSKVC